MSNEVKFTWRKDVNKEDKQQLALPAYFCRECGDSGWIAYKTKKSNSLDKDPGKTAIQFINNNENCWLLNLCKDDNKPIEEYQGITESWWIDPADLHVYDQQDEEKENRIHVYAMRKLMQGNMVRILALSSLVLLVAQTIL